MRDQLPTVPGKVDGVVSLSPFTLQCRDCGATAVMESGRIATFVILSGYHFHACEGRDGVRRCPDCLARVEAACPNKGRHS